MNVVSMTGFASQELQTKQITLKWEIKSVNHRYLEVFFKLPESLKQLESSLREIIRTYLHRGKVECFLQYHEEKETSGFSVNESHLKVLVQTSKQVYQHFKEEFPINMVISPLEVLNELRIDNTMDLLPDTKKDIIHLFKETLEKLKNEREKEGGALTKLILSRLEEMANLSEKIKTKIPGVLKNQRDKLLKRLHDLKSELNQDRLEQEMVFFAQKIDISEELDRLITHIKSAQTALNKGGVIGRQMDFLMQELNREANTLSSKSNDIEIVQMAMEIKLLIEQIREQVQNLE